MFGCPVRSGTGALLEHLDNDLEPSVGLKLISTTFVHL